MAKEFTPTTGTIQNTISAGTKIAGTIVADSDFHLDGEVKGDITCKAKIIIGQSGVVRGNLFCLNAEIYGVVEGNITTNGLLTLRSSARVKG
ncbi:MAG: polymer-forming cytoskeletal protein, partial [Bacteroidales bacterium]|nr:polymer-forming cytoskeletal protein [Bacteroidales bacterium]